MFIEPPQGRRPIAVACDVLARSAFRATVAEIPALRKAPGSLRGVPVAANVLRHADEQTVVGLVALLRAVATVEEKPGGFADWSVLAAPRFLGRAMFQVAFGQFLGEGAWGVSPHLIPAHSLHSPSGTFSQVLKAHGPNLGIGGTPGGEREALFAAATWIDARIAPGVWLVVTGRSGCGNGAVAVEPPGDYEAFALGLVPATVGARSPRLLIQPDGCCLDSIAGSDFDRAEVGGWLGLKVRAEAGPGSSWRVDAGHAPGGDRVPHCQPGPDRLAWASTADQRDDS